LRTNTLQIESMLKKLIVISLMLTLFGTPYAKAANLENPQFKIRRADPAGQLCLDQYELKDLATYKKSCDVCKRDLKSTRNALDKCYAGGPKKKSWLADRRIVIGGFTVGISLGVLIGLAVK